MSLVPTLGTHPTSRTKGQESGEGVRHLISATAGLARPTSTALLCEPWVRERRGCGKSARSPFQIQVIWSQPSGGPRFFVRSRPKFFIPRSSRSGFREISTPRIDPRRPQGPKRAPRGRKWGATIRPGIRPKIRPEIPPHLGDHPTAANRRPQSGGRF